MRPLLLGLLQLAGLVAALAGLYLLAGLAWCLVVGGALALAVGVLAEFFGPPAPARPRVTPRVRTELED